MTLVAPKDRLAAAVRARRFGLGDLTQAQVTERGGPSTETLRLIEGARQDNYSPRTLSRLDRALDWPSGYSAKILADASTEKGLDEEEETLAARDRERLGRAAEDRRLELGYTQEQLVELGSVDEDWDALASAVRSRREKMGLRQADLEEYGGPSSGTVRNIEQAARTRYSTKTKVQIERALRWRDGLVDDILAGTASSEDLEVEQSGIPPTMACTCCSQVRQLARDLPPLLDALAGALRKAFG